MFQYPLDLPYTNRQCSVGAIDMGHLSIYRSSSSSFSPIPQHWIASLHCLQMYQPIRCNTQTQNEETRGQLLSFTSAWCSSSEEKVRSCRLSYTGYHIHRTRRCKTFSCLERQATQEAASYVRDNSLVSPECTRIRDQHASMACAPKTGESNFT